MKYIVFDEMFPVCFHEGIQHWSVECQWGCRIGRPTSAGFFRIENGKVVTYDRSESLNLEPSEDDAELIQEMFGGGV